MTQPRLIVMSGLPGSGKSTIAAGLSKALAAPVVSVDPIEAAMWAAGIARDQTGIAAYQVARAVASENLKLGQTVLIDAVNPVEAARDMWRETAAARAVPLHFIEVQCRDVQVHQARIAQRVRNIQGMAEVTWADVQKRREEYEAWTGPRLVLDTTVRAPPDLIAKAMAYLAEEIGPT